MISFFYSGDLLKNSHGSSKYFNMLAKQTNGVLRSVGIPIESTTGLFLWQVNGKILRPRWIDKFLFLHLRSATPKIYSFLISYGPKWILERKFGPNHDFSEEIEASDVLVVGYMPFNVVRHFRKIVDLHASIVYVPFFHSKDPAHQKLKKSLRQADMNISLSRGEFGSLTNNHHYQLGAYLDDVWFESPRTLKETNDSYKVLWVGRKDVSKGADTFEQLSRECARSNIEFIAVGQGTEHFTGPITGLGKVSEVELIRLYDMCDIVVHTGIQESYSYTVVQSWARQTPVICLEENHATSSLVEESSGGWVVKDVLAMSAKIKGIAQDPNISLDFGLKGYKWASNNATSRAFNSRVSDFLIRLKNLSHDLPS
jgi:glycosyltransferase involved in cell wall biosynthesis